MVDVTPTPTGSFKIAALTLVLASYLEQVMNVGSCEHYILRQENSK
jgi:hypothetical protein